MLVVRRSCRVWIILLTLTWLVWRRPQCDAKRAQRKKEKRSPRRSWIETDKFVDEGKQFNGSNGDRERKLALVQL